MAKSRDKDSQRFRIYTSERSGFEFGFKPTTSPPNAYTRESGKPVKDNGLEVAPTEFDTPPPSKLPLGGADISGDPRANSDFSVDSNVYLIPSESFIPVYYITSSNSIPWNTEPVVYIGASNQNIRMAVNPQIVRGQENQLVAFQCVGSSITLVNGSGLTFDFNASQIVMNSGGIITCLYNATDNTWHITSFNPISGGF